MSVIPDKLIRVTHAVDYFKTPEFMAWRERVGTREANATGKKATTIGSRLHEIIESGDYHALSKDSKEVKNCLQAFLKWKERYHVENFQLPPRLNDEAIGLTGQPDFLWIDKKELVDFKTSKEIWPSNFFQLGGYKRLGIDAKTVAILRLDKEIGEFEYITNEMIGLSLESLVDAFEANFKHYQYYTHIQRKLSHEE